MTTRWLGLLAFCLVSGLTGCPATVPRPADGPTTPEPVLARLRERGEAISSLSGLLSIEAWRGDERVRARQLIMVQRPDRLRVDTLTPFDQPVSMMASDGVIVSIYSLEGRRYHQGKATPENLSRLLQLPLTGHELTALLSGGIPLLSYTEAHLDWDDGRGAYLLRLSAGTRRQDIWVESGLFRVLELLTYEGGTLVFSARFGDYSDRGPRAVPRRLRFEVPGRKLRVDAVLVDHALDVSPPEGAFQIPVPRGIEVEPL